MIDEATRQQYRAITKEVIAEIDAMTVDAKDEDDTNEVISGIVSVPVPVLDKLVGKFRDRIEKQDDSVLIVQGLILLGISMARRHAKISQRPPQSSIH
jgi:hypothetical protein